MINEEGFKYVPISPAEPPRWIYIEGKKSYSFEGEETNLIELKFQECKTGLQPSKINIKNWCLDFKANKAFNLTTKKNYRFRRIVSDVCPYEFAKEIDQSYLLQEKTSTLSPSNCALFFFFYDGTPEQWENYDSPTDFDNSRKNSTMWIPYEPAENKATSTNYRKWFPSQKDMSYPIGNTFYSINFFTWKQFRTEQARRCRNVRCAQVAWLWKNEATWEPYPPEISETIERAYITNMGEIEVQLKIANKFQPYIIHLIEMCQFRKESNYYRREIFRVGPPLTKIPRSILIKPTLASHVGVVMGSQYPAYWVAFEDAEVVEVDSASYLFEEISKLMNTTIVKEGHKNSEGISKFGHVPGTQSDPKRFHVHKIRQIQNSVLWEQYKYQKGKIQTRLTETGGAGFEVTTYLQKYPIFMPCMDKDVNEFLLFHGTSFEATELIGECGFDDRRASVTSMFGGGLYFSENSSKSNQYVSCPVCEKGSIPTKAKGPCTCPPSKIKSYTMIISRVLLGNAYIAKDKIQNQKGQRQAPRQPDGTFYDSVFAEKKVNGAQLLNHREFIVYERANTYPEFLVSYTRHEI